MAGATVVTTLRRRLRPRRMHAPPYTLVHCAHHKVGTVWWGNVLRTVAKQCGVRYAEVAGGDGPIAADVYLFQHSRHFDRARFTGRPFRGTHMIRDPRDIVVSGYFYHLWTTEPWANLPDPRYGGRSLREELNRRDRHDGLLLEIERVILGDPLRDMLTWDYAQPEFLELRYEDVIADEAGSFDRAFRHFGFTGRDVGRGLDIVAEMSFSRVAGRTVGEVGTATHLRSGRPGEWREHFDAYHLERWQQLAGAAVARLSYSPV
jgi:hypothetical protein